MAAFASEFPFKGECHHCHAAQATFSSPVEFHAMVERVMLSEASIYPISRQVLVLSTGKSEEKWVTVWFPLLLCDPSQNLFVVEQRRASRKALLKNAILFGLLAHFLYLVYLRPEAIVAISGLISLVGVVAWVATLRDTKKGETFLTKWLKGIGWVPEMIQGEQEYILMVGKCEPWHETL